MDITVLYNANNRIETDFADEKSGITSRLYVLGVARGGWPGVARGDWPGVARGDWPGMAKYTLVHTYIIDLYEIHAHTFDRIHGIT